MNRITVFGLLFNAMFAGAFLFIAVAILPFFEALSGAELKAWFNAHFLRFPMVMVPLNLLTFGCIAWGAIKAFRSKVATRNLWLLALLLIFLCSITYPVFFDGANKAIMDNAVSASDSLDIIGNWKMWHWIRTFIALLTLIVMSIIAATQSNK